MSVSIESLGIDRLSVGDRLDLIEKIWGSLPDQVDPRDVPAWHLEELTRRRAAAKAQPDIGKPWGDVLGPLETGK